MAIYPPPETIDEILEMDKLEYMENQNPIRDDERKDPHRVIKIELLGIIAAYQDPVCCNRIFRDFEEMNGYPLDPVQYGFKNFTSMMRTFSDKFISHNDGLKTTYTAKTTERSGHLQELIKNQVTIEEKRRRDMRRSRSYSRSRKSNYGAGIFYAQNFVPLLTDDRTAEERIADNLASFGRSLAADLSYGGTGLDWGGRSSRLNEDTSSESDNEGGLILRSRSMPPQRKPAEETVERTTNVFNDPKSTNLDDCTNPFRVQNNVRIRDIVMQHGEADDGGRRGMAVVEVASKFRKDFRLPLGGVPNMPEERLIQKMQAVETVEWVVEKMGDGNYYVIVPVETIKRAKEVGPGSRSDAPAIPAEKPKSTGISPAAKRMFGFALKSAMSNNTRMEGTRERVLKERIYATEMYDGEIVCDSDGDPVMTHIPVQKENKIEHEISQSFDREHIMALDNKAALSRDIEWKAGKMRILRSQPITNPCRPSPSSSNSSVIGNRGNTSKPVAGSSRPSPPNPSSSMFGGPSFGTFRGAPHPDSLAPVEKDDDSSEIIQPTQSSLASKLPQSTFASTLKQSASAFSSAVGTAAGAALTPMFGTRNQSVPSPVTASRPAASAFGVSAPAPTSAFGGIRVSPPSSVSVPPRKLVEVIESDSEKEKSKPKGAELLGATIQLIGELRGGAVVYIHQIEGKPVEDVVAGNCDFFDIDEDERIHLLHNVDPLLLTYEGIPIGEIIEDEKKKEVVEEKKKEEDPPKEVKLTAFSRPAPPSFGGVSSRAVPLFGLSRPTETTSAFATKPREVPTFGRPVKIVDDEPNERSASGLSIGVSSRVIPPFGGTINQKVEEVKESNERPASSQSVGVSSRVVPSFGGMASQKVEEVKERAPSVMSTASTLESPKPQPGMPSFGTKSLHVPERPDSALSNRSEDPPRKVSNVSTSGGLPRQEERAEEFVVATFGGSEPVERPHSALSDSSSGSDITVESTQGSKYRTAESDFSGRNTESMVSHSSIHSSKDELDRDEKEDEELAEERVENSSGPYAFPNHPDIRRLSRKASVAFDSVKRGHLYMGSILTSIEPNRLVMTLREGDMMQKVQMIMRELGAAYGEQPPLGAANVRLGQFAVAINGQVIVRVVVLRYLKESDEFLCACLDIHALIEVAAQNLYELYDRFGVHALRASTFIARINGLPNLGEKGHKAVSMIVKGEEDDSFKKPSPFVFHGKDDVTDDILVDVAVLIAGTPMWMGESLGPFIGVTCYNLENVVNPGIQHAIKFAIEHELEGYELPEKIEKKEADVESESYTPNEADLNTIRCDSVENVQELVASMQVTPKEEEEEKEEGELDSSHDDSTASERTTVDRHAAGVADFVGDVKGKQMDEFVVVAPAPVKAIIDVESMTALIRLFNKKGEHVSADVIKAMCRALVLSANNTLSTLGERGSLIANAEALEAIDMA